MKLAEIQLGEKLEIDVYGKLGEKVKTSLVSELELVENESTALIAAPMFEGAVYDLQIDDLLEVYLINKVDKYRIGLYAFKAKVISRAANNNIMMFRIK